MALNGFQLVMQSGPNPGKTYELTEDEITIGRDVSNSIVINDPEISRQHIRLSLQTDGYVIEDLGSTNGTFVDGQRLLGPHILKNEEALMLGEKVSFIFKSLGFDPDATLIGESVEKPKQQAPPDTFRVPPSEQPYKQPPIPKTEVFVSEDSYQGISPAESPMYNEPVPKSPEEPEVSQPIYDEPTGSKGQKNKPLILAGCGCLVLLLICVIGGAFAFDKINLYCTSPFDILSGILWSCPP
jgi:predicted component of type VI protein secretion system